MRLNVFFTPSELAATNASADDIYIVIDVIRATTSLVVIFDRGARRVFAADTIEQAQEAAAKAPGRLLCGERNASQIPGFDYGNSPVQFAEADLSGRDLILTTTNGTRAFFACPLQSVRLAGCFYNAQAVTARALALAQERGSNIALVCAGVGGYFALDDATCAGYLALEIQRQSPDIRVRESVHAATTLYQTYAPPRLLDHCVSARAVTKAGLELDLMLCMTANASASVPMVAGREEETGLLMLLQYPQADRDSHTFSPPPLGITIHALPEEVKQKCTLGGDADELSG
ncbi:MAG TPA: 2-phosphosulfolactate phosphatase [Ktedonobacteraceae bacterium]|nr:2-phosphosulfolactate phosphatase [Ktedonobacteraceae bacterium]